MLHLLRCVTYIDLFVFFCLYTINNSQLMDNYFISNCSSGFVSLEPVVIGSMLSNQFLHTPARKTVTPALRQTGTAIYIRYTWCIKFRWDSFNIKQCIIHKPLRLVSSVISLLEPYSTPSLSRMHLGFAESWYHSL